MIQRFYRINDDLYRGSAPTTKDVVDLHDQYGINKIVSLDKSAGEHISRICKLLGIEHIIIPIDATELEPMAALMNWDIKELLLDNGPTYVHCIQGKDRTGMVIAMYECSVDGVPYKEAIKHAKALGFGSGIPEQITKFYERAIKAYCNDEDTNDADIVDNTRQWRNEWRDSYLNEADMKGGWGPFQDPAIREYPFSRVYDYAYDPKDNTRDWKDIPVDLGETGGTPLVGIYESDAGIHGVGPVENGGGFVNS
jgi:protein tyrosine/serine phosphatase